MDDRGEHTHLLASLARRPMVCALAVLIFGGGCLLASMLVPLGLPFLTLAITGSVAVVTGALTIVVLSFGRLLGLRGRSASVVSDGRANALFPGKRPAPMHVASVGGARRRSPAAAPATGDPAPTDDAAEVSVVDLRQPAHQDSAA